jgi:hypothetical protein
MSQEQLDGGIDESKDEDGQTIAEIVAQVPEISGKQVYYIGVCEAHLLNESFVLKSYRTKMPAHWRIQRIGCAHSNCYQDATNWLIVDLSEATFSKKGRKLA